MFLKRTYSSKTGRTYLSMVHGYRDKGHSRSKTIETFGYLDELEKEYTDPIAHFTKLVEERNKATQEESEYKILVKKNQELPKNTSSRMNYGYIYPRTKTFAKTSP